jgi:hypothetical protein
VAFSMEREDLGKERNEPVSVVAFESHLPGVKRKGEADGDVQALDAKLEAFDAAPALAFSRATQRTLLRGFSPDS